MGFGGRQGCYSGGRGMKYKEYKILRFTDVGGRSCLSDMNCYAKRGFVIVKYETYVIHNAIWYSILMEREVDG